MHTDKYAVVRCFLNKNTPVCNRKHPFLPWIRHCIFTLKHIHQGLKNPLARRLGLVISTFGLAEIISCMPDGLVKKYIGYGQTCQYSCIYLYSACLLPSVDGLVKKICIGCHPTRQ